MQLQAEKKKVGYSILNLVMAVHSVSGAVGCNDLKKVLLTLIGQDR
jgi:hypothetical protein